MTYAEKMPPFEDSQVGIAVDVDGRREFVSVPGQRHPWAPGLAIIMRPFGLFSVTHVPTGMGLSNSYERVANAQLTLAECAMVARVCGVRWDDPGFESLVFVLDHGSKPVPFDGYYTQGADGVKKPHTIREWIEHLRSDIAQFVGEFPWEDKHPGNAAAELLRRAHETAEPVEEG